VGSSRGEDVGTAANRAWGSLAGMLVGIVASHLPPHPGISVAVGIGLTAYLCMAVGWGQSAARIGASMCAVTVLAHSQDAIEYTAMRLANTLIGIAAGLAVSYFVLPVRGRDVMAGDIKRALDAVAQLLGILSRPDPAPEKGQYVAVFDSMVALEKTLRDARKEIGGEFEALYDTGRQVAVVCVGALSAGLAHAELAGSPGTLEAAAALRGQAAALALRAKASEVAATPPPASIPLAGAGARETRLDDIALQGFAHGLRKIDHALRALGH
jgi:hypothetical protein